MIELNSAVSSKRQENASNRPINVVLQYDNDE